MGRGKSWDATELGELARAWVRTSEDPVTGIDQTAARFTQTLFDNFCANAPVGAPEKTYALRSPHAVKQKFDDVSTEIQKFRKSLRKVYASSPTGVTEDNILSMAIAMHIGKTDSMCYEYKDLSHSLWLLYKAYNIFKTHPKLSSGINHGANRNSSLETPLESESQELYGAVENNRRAQNSYQTPDIGERIDAAQVLSSMSSEGACAAAGSRGTEMGRKAAKRAKTDEAYKKLALLNSSKIAAALEAKAVLMEERNALILFSDFPCSTPQEKSAQTEYFSLLRASYLSRAKRRCMNLTEECEAVEGNTTGVDLETEHV
jgi:hypothetical protein